MDCSGIALLRSRADGTHITWPLAPCKPYLHRREWGEGGEREEKECDDEGEGRMRKEERTEPELGAYVIRQKLPAGGRGGRAAGLGKRLVLRLLLLQRPDGRRTEEDGDAERYDEEKDSEYGILSAPRRGPSPPPAPPHSN